VRAFLNVRRQLACPLGVNINGRLIEAADLAPPGTRRGKINEKATDHRSAGADLHGREAARSHPACGGGASASARKIASMTPRNGPSLGFVRGVSWRYPGGAENAKHLSTVSR
jgi:hypothetical protein